MSTLPHGTASIHNLKESGQRNAQDAASSPLMEALTRIGFAARGLIYLTMGFLAVQFALGRGGTLATPQGAIAAIGKWPGGAFLLWGVLVGILSYALWGVVRAIMDPFDKGSGAKGLVARFGYLASAFGYVILALPTYNYIIGAAQSGSSTPNFMGTLMAMPWGRVVVGLIGLCIIASGLYQVYLGLSASFDRQFHTYALNPKEVKVITDIGRFGTAARGVVFAIVGGLLVLAAYQANPTQAIGMDTAMATIMHQPYGVWVLAIIAAGLVAFGFYSLLSAVWFRLKR